MPVVISSYVLDPPDERVEFPGGVEAWDRAWRYAMELGCELAEHGYKVIPDPDDFSIAATRNGNGDHRIIQVLPDEPEMRKP